MARKNKILIQRDSKRWTQTACLLKLVIPTTNALPRWRLNVETKTKRTLHSSRRLSFNELTNAKNIFFCIVAIFFQLTLLHGCAIDENSNDSICKFSISSFKCYGVYSYTMYSSENIDVRNWVQHFKSRRIITPFTLNEFFMYKDDSQCCSCKRL